MVRYVDYRSVAVVSISASWRHWSAAAFVDWAMWIDTHSRRAIDLRVLVRTLLHNFCYLDISVGEVVCAIDGSAFEHRQFDGARGGALQVPGRWTHLKSLSLNRPHFDTTFVYMYTIAAQRKKLWRRRDEIPKSQFRLVCCCCCCCCCHCQILTVSIRLQPRPRCRISRCRRSIHDESYVSQPRGFCPLA
jgi:hypothetical protein